MKRTDQVDIAAMNARGLCACGMPIRHRTRYAAYCVVCWKAHQEAVARSKKENPWMWEEE